MTKTKDTKKLSFNEQYDLKIELVVNGFSCKYEGCGSHKLRLSMVADLEELRDLYKLLSEIKGIKEQQ